MFNREVPGVVYTESSVTEVEEVMTSVCGGWAEVVVKCSVHHTLPSSLHPTLHTLQLTEAVNSLRPAMQSSVLQWTDNINTLVRNFSSRLTGQLLSYFSFRYSKLLFSFCIYFLVGSGQLSFYFISITAHFLIYFLVGSGKLRLYFISITAHFF